MKTDKTRAESEKVMASLSQYLKSRIFPKHPHRLMDWAIHRPLDCNFLEKVPKDRLFYGHSNKHKQHIIRNWGIYTYN
jgi:hypothetical protein